MKGEWDGSSHNRWRPRWDDSDEVVYLCERERERHTEKEGLIDKPVCWESRQLAKLCMRASEQLRYLSQWLLALLLMKTCIWTRTANQAEEAGTSDIFLAKYSDEAPKKKNNPKNICSFPIASVYASFVWHNVHTDLLISVIADHGTMLCCSLLSYLRITGFGSCFLIILPH